MSNVDTIELERAVGTPIAMEVEFRGAGTNTPAVAVELGQVWFICGRTDYSEVRIVRADRLAESIGIDLALEYWLYQGEAFDTLPQAAVALPEVLDPASWRNKPVGGQAIMLDAGLRQLADEFERVLGREQIVLTIVRRPPALPRLGHIAQYAAALKFMPEHILGPFGDTSSYAAFQQVDGEQGQGWTDADFNSAFDVLHQLQQELEAPNDAP